LIFRKPVVVQEHDVPDALETRLNGEADHHGTPTLGWSPTRDTSSTLGVDWEFIWLTKSASVTRCRKMRSIHSYARWVLPGAFARARRHVGIRALDPLLSAVAIQVGREIEIRRRVGLLGDLAPALEAARFRSRRPGRPHGIAIEPTRPLNGRLDTKPR
jgi:hypothetical protein